MQKLAGRGRRHQRLNAEQLRQTGIRAQDIQIEQAIATQNGIPAEAQNILRFRVAALSLFEMKLGVNQLRQSNLSGEIPQQHDAHCAGQGLIAKTDIEFESFAKNCSIHLTGDSFRRIWILVAPLFYALAGSPVTIFKEL